MKLAPVLQQITNLNKIWRVNSQYLIYTFFAQDEDSLFRTLAAVLHLGDLRFTQSDKDMARLVNQEVLDKVSILLQVSADELGGAIVSETTYTRGTLETYFSFIISHHHSLPPSPNKNMFGITKLKHRRLMRWKFTCYWWEMWGLVNNWVIIKYDFVNTKVNANLVFNPFPIF